MLPFLPFPVAQIVLPNRCFSSSHRIMLMINLSWLMIHSLCRLSVSSRKSISFLTLLIVTSFQNSYTLQDSSMTPTTNGNPTPSTKVGILIWGRQYKTATQNNWSQIDSFWNYWSHGRYMDLHLLHSMCIKIDHLCDRSNSKSSSIANDIKINILLGILGIDHDIHIWFIDFQYYLMTFNET